MWNGMNYLSMRNVRRNLWKWIRVIIIWETCEWSAAAVKQFIFYVLVKLLSVIWSWSGSECSGCLGYSGRPMARNLNSCIFIFSCCDKWNIMQFERGSRCILYFPLPSQNQIKYFDEIFWSDEKQIFNSRSAEVLFFLLLVINYNSAILLLCISRDIFSPSRWLTSVRLAIRQ